MKLLPVIPALLPVISALSAVIPAQAGIQSALGPRLRGHDARRVIQ